MGTHHPIRKTVAPEPVQVPDKLYFRIGDVAKLCDVEPYVLRFWETEFKNLKPNKGGTGQRLYRKRDVEIALRIKTLLYDQGYTIPGARQIFQCEASRSEHSFSGTPVKSVILSGGPELAEGAQSKDPEGLQLAPASSSFQPASPRTLAQIQTLATLRDDLRSLAAQLSKAPIATPDNPPKRPRLVLEPKPAQKPSAKPEPTLHLAQRDLFAAE